MGLPALAQSGQCYVSSDANDRLQRVTFSAGAITTRTDIGSFAATAVNIECIAWQRGATPGVGVLFGGDQDTAAAAGSQGRIGTFNLTTGVFTRLPNPLGTGNGALGTLNLDDVDCLTFNPTPDPILPGNPTNVLWAGIRRTGTGNDVLVKVNTTTGQRIANAFGAGVDYLVVNSVALDATIGGGGSLEDTDDITFASDPTTPTTLRLYAIVNTSTAVAGNKPDQLVIINTSTGACTLVGTSLRRPDGTTIVRDMEGLTTSNDGTLYGSTGNDAGGGANTGAINRLWRINKTVEAGGFTIATEIGTIPTGGSGDFEGVAFFDINPTEVKLQNFEAVSYSNGEVGLTWNTGFEADNLGFRVWREINGKRELVTGNGLVAGNALMAGTTLTAGNRYAWRDTAVASKPIRAVVKSGRLVHETTLPASTVSYWLEDIDLNGKSSWNGPFELKISKESIPESLRNAPLLGRNNPVFGAQTSSALISGDPSALALTIAERSMVQTSAKSPTSSAFQQTLAAGPAVKLGVRATGWQSVSRSSLVSAGLNPGAVDANLRMYVNGQEVPIRVSASSVEFYGVAADTLQSGEQTYWLVEGTSAGLRIPVLPFTGGSKVGAVNFPSLVERRDRTVYFAALQNGDADNFFGAVVTNSAVDQAVTLRNRDANAATPAQVAVTLQGVSQTDHRVTVKLNGTALGDVVFNGRGQQTFTASVPQSQLLEGQNTVTLQAVDSGDVNLVAAIRVSYARSFVADADALSLSSRAGQTLTVRGFSQAPRVFDVTDPANPMEVFVRADGAGEANNITASFVAPGTAGSTRQLLATTAGRFLTPTVTANTPSTLSATTNAADFVIITTPEFAPALTPLVQLRQSQGLTVKVVDIADVYDEFSFGVKSAQAVKDFLNLASHTWQTPVRYAMFAGDASFDPRDFLGFNQDVIPTKLLGLGSLETASDDWFGDFDDSGLSQIAIGRLPARSTGDIAAMVSKIVAYDRSGGGWQREALLVADNNDDGGAFEQNLTEIESLIPAGFTKTSVFVGQIGGDAARGQVLAGLNSGKGFVNYMGHGSVSNWAAENVLTSGDVSGLGNQGRAGLVVDMACLNGFFHDVYSESLAKSLIRTNGRGAAAVWASTSLTGIAGQQEMNLEFTRTIFGTQETRLGDAIRQAKTATADPFARRSWVLLGDPTMRIVK